MFMISMRKGHRKFFMYHDRELWSSDSEDEDFVLSAPEKKTTRTRHKKAKLSEEVDAKCVDHSQSEIRSVKESNNLWGERVPVEILFKIFKYVLEYEESISSLKSISKVCSLWHEVSLIPSLWTKIDFSSVPPKKEATFTKFFQQKLINLVSVNLAGWSILKPHSWELLAESCPRLECIDLTGTKITGPSLLTVAIKCSSLNSITLSKIETNAVSAGVLIQLFEVMNKKLKSFCLSYCSINGFSKLFGVLLARCPNMETFELSGIRSNCSMLMKVKDIQMAWRNLKVLRLTNGSISCMQEDDCPGFPELRELSLCNLKNMKMQENNFIFNLIFNSEKLVLLDLRMTSHLPPPVGCSLDADNITHLFLNKTTGCHLLLGFMLKKWKHSLIELDISDIIYPRNDFSTLIEVMIMTKPFPSLKILSIRGMPITPKHVLSIIDSCPNLKELDLAQCRELPRGTKKLHNRSSMDDLITVLQQLSTKNNS